MYREEIMDHYKRPRNTGRLEEALEAEGENASCGDKVHVYVRTEEGEIEEFRHETDACAICTASVSILSQEIEGKKVLEVRQLEKDWMIDQLGIDVSPMRVKCAVLGLEVVKQALT